jgi:membrane protein implicated in regulation of membrane protease activity
MRYGLCHDRVRLMTAIYGFFAVVGGVLALIMALGLGDTDTEIDLDADLDFDADAGNGLSSGAGSVVASLLSFRTLVFVAAFFGVTGLVLPVVGAGPVITLIAAISVGVFAGFLNDRLVHYVKRTSGGVGVEAIEMSGMPATVKLPVAHGRRGKVQIELDGRSVSMVAEPYIDGDRAWGVGDTVVVVEVRNGVARVGSLELE